MEKRRLNDKWARIIGIPLIVVLLQLFANNPWQNLPINLKVLRVIKNFLYVAFYWEGNRIIFIYLRNKFPRPKDMLKKIGIQAVIFVLFICIFGFIVALINQSTPIDSHESFSMELTDTLKKSAVLLLIITVCYECAFFFGNWEHSLYESERLKKESVISQFELLKNQISPHFLFNSLNALITLVPEDAQLSVLFIQKLSNVYRHVLTYNDKNIIEMNAELEFLKDYLFLFQMRFGENLIIEYKLSESFENVMTIPFALQMLVENAIKHNTISQRKPLIISLISDGEIITIKNNLQKKTSGVESTNTGLNNITSRFKLLTARPVKVIITATEFSVSLPLLNKISMYESINH